MPAKFFYVLRTVFQGVKNVHAFNTARAPFEHVAVTHEQQRGTIVFFRDTRRNDPHEPAVPTLVREHDYVAVSTLFQEFPLCRRIQIVAAFLPFGIVHAKLGRQIVNFRFVFGYKQTECRLRVPHSARGVYARRNVKCQRLRGNAVVIFADQY